MIKRYSEVGVESHGDVWAVMEENEDGEYVKYEDVEELINPWKDASKELPKEVDRIILCKPKDIGTTYFTIKYENWGNVPEPFSKEFAEITDSSGRGIEYASHWMYIPEVNNED